MLSETNLTIEYVIIGVYLAVLIGLGAIFGRFNKDTDDYFKSGSKGTWWLVGMSTFMSGISALTFTGNGGAAFEAGWSVLVIYAGNVIGFVISGLFLAAWYRQLRATTFPEVMRERFGPVTQQVYAYFFMIWFLWAGAIWLWGLGIFTSAVFNIPVGVVIPVLGVVVLVYSTTGGRWAVMATDFVQGMVMIPATVLLAGVCVWQLGGVSGVFERIEAAGLGEDFALIKPEGAFPAGAYTWSWAVAILILQISQNCSLALSMRYFAVKDGRSASKAAWMTCILMALGTLLWFIPPMTARLLFEEQVMGADLSKPAEAAFAVASLNLLPSGMVGIVIIAMFAATMSSMDTGLNVNAAMLVRDVVPALRRRLGWGAELTAKTELRASQAVTVVFGAMMTFLAMHLAKGDGKGMFEVVLEAATFLSLPLTMPLVLAVFIKRVPGWAALATVAAGLVVTPVMGWDTPFHERAMGIFVTCCVVYAGSGFFWQTASEEYRARVEAFFERMHTPVDFEKEVGGGNDLSQLKILGGFTATIGVLLFLLLLIPNPVEGRWLIAALATCVSLSGGGMWWRGRSAETR